MPERCSFVAMNHYYHPDPESNSLLSPEESTHAIKVLRKKVGDELKIIDGKGSLFHAKISNANFRKCEFEIKSKKEFAKRDYAIHVAIAPTKNIDRLEWFVEKACEIGIDEISLFETKRTERTKVNLERLEKKAISALKQSKGYWKCGINPLIQYADFQKSDFSDYQKFIAFVDSENPANLSKAIKPKKDTLVLIGPEGDFTQEEVTKAVTNGFQKVSMGTQVLRTETAGLMAIHTTHLINEL